MNDFDEIVRDYLDQSSRGLRSQTVPAWNGFPPVTFARIRQPSRLRRWLAAARAALARVARAHG